MSDADAQLGSGGRPSVPLVRVPFPRDEANLTPYTFELGYPLMTLVYDTLLWRDADGMPQPWLARSVDMSPDGLRLTIELDDGARWHDGMPLTSADVAFTFAYVRDHPHARFTPPLRVVAGVDTPTPTTVVVRLVRPSPGFADQPLADLPILPAHIWSLLRAGEVAPEGLAIGSGPYRLAEHQPQKSYRFEAVPDYFRGQPPVQAIEVSIISDAQATFTALERAELDMIPVTVSPAVSTELRSLGATVVEGAGYVGTTLLMNTRRPPFDRVDVRRAVAEALDLDRIRRFVGGGVVADRGYVHPDSSWASPDPLHRFDQAAARSILSGVEDPSPVRLLVPDDDPVKREAGRQVAFALDGAGLPVEVVEVGRDTLSSALGETVNAADFAMAIGSISPLGSFDPGFLARVFGTDPRDAVLNPTGYASAEFDSAIARVSTTVDADARRAATEEALSILARDAPAVPLFFSAGSYAFRTRAYDGWVNVKGTGILDKRSFVEPVSPAGPLLPEGPVPTTEPPLGSSDGGSLPYGLLALVALGSAGVLMVIAIRRG